MIRLLAPYAIGAALCATLIGGAFYAGVNYARDKAALDAAEDFKEGTKDAQDALDDLPSGDSDRIEWLRDFINGR